MLNVSPSKPGKIIFREWLTTTILCVTITHQIIQKVIKMIMITPHATTTHTTATEISNQIEQTANVPVLAQIVLVSIVLYYVYVIFFPQR